VQARIFDFTRRFNEAASRYHELSFDSDIAEEERMYMLWVWPIKRVFQAEGKLSELTVG
jgi:COP9 signalosome complex subunit 4